LRLTDIVIKFWRMSRIEFEDRTQEPPAVAANRQVEAASQAIIGTTILVSQGDPSIGLGALTRALGQGAARTGASLDEVIEALRASYATAMEELAALAGRRISDA
jgi:hypothetical protein